MKWVKSAITGAVGSLIIFIVTLWAINVADIAPYNVSPATAFLAKLQMDVPPLPLIVHFLYGSFWSVVFVAYFGSRISPGKGLMLSLVVWVIMMAVYSPIIGWGFFGFGGSGSELPADHPLHLGSSAKYLLFTLFNHIIYGAVIGIINPIWLKPEHEEEQIAEQQHRIPVR